jgi:DNA-binding CsgD family transcriptional regulator
MECRHLDGDPTNNNVSNLQWGTRKDNVADAKRHGTIRIGERAFGSVLTAKRVIAARKMYANGTALNDIAREFGISYATLSSAILGKSWKHIGGAAAPRRQKQPQTVLESIVQRVAEGDRLIDIANEMDIAYHIVVDCKRRMQCNGNI